MLTEPEVIKAVIRYLKRKRFRIISHSMPPNKGPDIVAEDMQGKTLVIEAKGDTSYRASSKRYGQPFKGQQLYPHFAKALLACFVNQSVGRAVGMALPDNKGYTTLLLKTKHVLVKNEIRVFLAKDSGQVILF